MARKNHFTLQVITDLDMAEMLAKISVRGPDFYIAIEKIETYTPKVVVRGRPKGAATNAVVKARLEGKTDEEVVRTAGESARRAVASIHARLQKSVEMLAKHMMENPSMTMEQYCLRMTASGATNRYNKPWTPKNLWPYYEKAYALVEGKIQLSYVERPNEVSDEFAAS